MGWQVIDIDGVLVRNGKGVLQRAFHLPDVPRPSVIHETVQGLSGQSADRFAGTHGQTLDEGVDQQRDVVLASAQ